MGAYNWIHIEEVCEGCGARGLKAQTHIASDYGDSTGQFFDRTYRLGERMAWWNQDDPRFEDWAYDNGWMRSFGPGSVADFCPTECLNCGAETYSIIEFHPLKPVRVVWSGPEDEIPEDYWERPALQPKLARWEELNG